MFDWLKALAYSFSVKNLFKEKPKSRLGIDLGSSIIKIVEISPGAEKLKLETYGLASFSTEGFLSHAFSSFVDTRLLDEAKANFKDESGVLPAELLPASLPEDFDGELSRTADSPLAGKSAINDLSNKEISQIIRELAFQAQVKTNIAYFSVPASAIFSTIIDLPFMPAEELAAAIPYEAKKYIPVPLDEVVLDWVLLEQSDDQEKKSEALTATGNEVAGDNKNKGGKQEIIIDRKEPLAEAKQAGVKVFLVAMLKEIIEKYTLIAQLAGLEIRSLEAESLCLARSLAGGQKGFAIIISIGERFIDITLIEDGFVKVIHNAESAISRDNKTVDKEKLVAEIERVINLYKQSLSERPAHYSEQDARYKSKLGEEKADLTDFKFVLTGGKALAYNLDYLKEHFQSEISVGDPFAQLEYPEILSPILKKLGPSLAAAAGMAMKQ